VVRVPPIAGWISQSIRVAAIAVPSVLFLGPRIRRAPLSSNVPLAGPPSKG
jgi:hypothetical protein